MLNRRRTAWQKELETNQCGLKEYAERTINLIDKELANLKNKP